MTKNLTKTLINLKKEKLSFEQINDCANSNFYLDKVKKKFGNKSYTMLILSLTTEEMENSVAKVYWEELVNHMSRLNETLGRNVGISVAAMDYLHNIKQVIDKPVILREEKIEEISDLASKDPLTNLYNREVFDTFLKQEVHRANRESKPTSLVLLDIDNFKRINDTKGHVFGDDVLKYVAKTVMTVVRVSDIPCRYGGEEFAIIMPQCHLDEAINVAEAIRLKISKKPMDDIFITVSIGVSQVSDFIGSSKKLLSTADDALYQAKTTGKNKVIKFT